ncbi:MAG: hypothetical protein OWU84_00215 [Firmicutes bacterium]|nr:hypothetical protein [Bacillota bacterium]
MLEQQESQTPPELNATPYMMPIRVVTHYCRQCGQPFPYHYDVFYDPEHLLDIDFICRSCLGSFVRAFEDAHRHP